MSANSSLRGVVSEAFEPAAQQARVILNAQVLYNSFGAIVFNNALHGLDSAMPNSSVYKQLRRKMGQKWGQYTRKALLDRDLASAIWSHHQTVGNEWSKLPENQEYIINLMDTFSLMCGWKSDEEQPDRFKTLFLPSMMFNFSQDVEAAWQELSMFPLSKRSESQKVIFHFDEGSSFLPVGFYEQLLCEMVISLRNELTESYSLSKSSMRIEVNDGRHVGVFDLVVIRWVLSS